MGFSRLEQLRKNCNMLDILKDKGGEKKAGQELRLLSSSIKRGKAKKCWALDKNNYDLSIEVCLFVVLTKIYLRFYCVFTTFASKGDIDSTTIVLCNIKTKNQFSTFKTCLVPLNEKLPFLRKKINHRNLLPQCFTDFLPIIRWSKLYKGRGCYTNVELLFIKFIN